MVTFEVTAMLVQQMTDPARRVDRQRAYIAESASLAIKK